MDAFGEEEGEEGVEGVEWGGAEGGVLGEGLTGVNAHGLQALDLVLQLEGVWWVLFLEDERFGFCWSY